MNLKNLRTSIQTTITEGNLNGHHESKIARNVYLLVLVAGWPYNGRHNMVLDQLSDSEYRIASEWVSLTRNDYRSTVNQIQDMREILPGLTLGAMADLIKGGR